MQTLNLPVQFILTDKAIDNCPDGLGRPSSEIPCLILRRPPPKWLHPKLLPLSMTGNSPAHREIFAQEPIYSEPLIFHMNHNLEPYESAQHAPSLPTHPFGLVADPEKDDHTLNI